MGWEIKDIRNMFRILLGHLYDYNIEDTNIELDIDDKLTMLKLYDYLVKVNHAYENLNYSEVYKIMWEYFSKEV